MGVILPRSGLLEQAPGEGRSKPAAFSVAIQIFPSRKVDCQLAGGQVIKAVLSLFGAFSTASFAFYDRN
jgi:hypothetical protein